MKNTMSVDLHMLQLRLKPIQVTEADDRFEIPMNLGGGATLLLTCPKELPLDEPGYPVDPLEGVDDLGGLLVRHFGGEYEQCTATALPGTYYPATDDCPERFDIATDAFPAPHALIYLSWALDNPPTDVGLHSTFGQRQQALFYHRVDQADADCDYAGDHGTDLWIMPTTCLGEFQNTLQQHADRRQLEIELKIKRYFQSVPYYRNFFHEEDGTIEDLKWKLEYGDEYATLVLGPGEEHETRTPLYYNEAYLKTLRHAIMHGMKMSLLGDLFGGLAGIIALGL